MIRIVKISFATLAGVLILASCGGGVKSKAEDLADLTCDCVQKSIDLDNIMSFGPESLDRVAMQSCIASDSKEYLEYFKDLSENDRKEFVREYMKALLDTECADVLLDQGMSMMNESMLDRAIEEME